MDDDTKKAGSPEMLETVIAPQASTEALVSAPASAPVSVLAPRQGLSDKDVFFRLLPGLCGSFATQYNDPKTVMALGIELAREETGRMADLGVCERTIMCRDGRPLALQVYLAPPQYRSTVQQPAPAPNQHPQQEGALPLANTNGRGLQGQMVAHFETNSIQKIQGL
jgi:hypothetical protein